MDAEDRVQISETLRLGLVLAVVGGYLDAYTYLCRGGVFANAETGNMVLLGINLASGEWMKALKYLLPVVAFFCGILLAERIRTCFRKREQQGFHWRHAVLLIEISVLALVSFMPMGGRWDMVVNWSVGFVCALQVESFRKVRGRAYATTMCTGNLRSGTELLSRYLETKEKKLLIHSLRYYAVIALFILGASVSVHISPLLGQYSPLVACGGLLVAFLMMLRTSKV